MKKDMNCTLDHTTRAIVCSKKFIKEASAFGSQACKLLAEIQKAYPAYEVSVREIKVKPGKNTYKNLDYDYMEAHIKKIDGENSTHMAEFQAMKERDAVTHVPYATVKKWFLDHYKKSLPNIKLIDGTVED